MVLMEIQRHRQVWDQNRTLGERTRRSLAAQTFVGWLNTTCHIATESLGKTNHGDLKACLAYAKIVCMLVITSHFSSRSERVSQSRSEISLLRLSRPPYHPKYSFSFSQISRYKCGPKCLDPAYQKTKSTSAWSWCRAKPKITSSDRQIQRAK